MSAFTHHWNQFEILIDIIDHVIGLAIVNQIIIKNNKIYPNKEKHWYKYIFVDQMWRLESCKNYSINSTVVAYSTILYFAPYTFNNFTLLVQVQYK
jgi:hypothetical protein